MLDVNAHAGCGVRNDFDNYVSGLVTLIHFVSDIPSMSYGLLYGERTLRCVANATRRDARELLSLAAEIPVRTQVEVFPLSNANLALQQLKAGEINGSAVLRVQG